MYKTAAYRNPFHGLVLNFSGTLGPYLAHLGVGALDTVSPHMGVGHIYLAYVSNGIGLR